MLPAGGRVAVAIIGVGIALVVGAAYLFGWLPAPGFAAASQAAAIGDGEVLPPGPLLVLKERVVNLADPGSRRYLRIAMSIEFAAGAAEVRQASAEARSEKQTEFDHAMEPRVPLIEDAIIALLTARTVSDVSTPEGKLQLKNEIRDSLNNILGEEQVVNVYFTQFLMQ